MSFFLCGFYVNNVSALDDITVTYSKSSLPSYLFSDVSADVRSQYKYLKVDCILPDGSSCNFGAYNSSNSFAGTLFDVEVYLDSSSTVCGSFAVFPSSSPSFFELCSYNSFNSSVSAFPRFVRKYNRSLSSDTRDYSFTFTLMESLPAADCPVCEECQVCPAIPENPYDDKFDKIITAIYVCAATILVVYFFYCIYRMIIKSAGSV